MTEKIVNMFDEKQELYTTLAKFNVELLQKLLAIKKEKSVE